MSKLTKELQALITHKLKKAPHLSQNQIITALKTRFGASAYWCDLIADKEVDLYGRKIDAQLSRSVEQIRKKAEDQRQRAKVLEEIQNSDWNASA